MTRPWLLLAALWLLLIAWAVGASADSRVEWRDVSPSLPPASVELVAITGAGHVA